LNQALRDKFVCGSQSQSIRKRLLAEKDLATKSNSTGYKILVCPENSPW